MFNSDLNCFADWIHENNCMESTGKYWVPAFHILEKRGIRVIIAIARMILTAAFVMLFNLEEWNPVGLLRSIYLRIQRKSSLSRL